MYGLTIEQINNVCKLSDTIHVSFTYVYECWLTKICLDIPADGRVLTKYDSHSLLVRPKCIITQSYYASSLYRSDITYK